MKENKLSRRGKDAPNWKGGVQYDGKGYVRVWNPEHPRADKKGYVDRSYLVAEKVLGRYLRPDEIPHHINGIKDDDRAENLMVMIQSAHLSIHAPSRKKLNIKKTSSTPIPEDKLNEFVEKKGKELHREFKDGSLSVLSFCKHFTNKTLKECDELKEGK